MAEIRIGYGRQVRAPHEERNGATAPGSQRPSRPRSVQTPRCRRHPGVHMVLAGINAQWNTVRYLCPLCNAMGQPPIELATGVVTSYDRDRGYGFIANGGPRIFFHASALLGCPTPYVGMPVSCHVEQNEHGLCAREVYAL